MNSYIGYDFKRGLWFVSCGIYKSYTGKWNLFCGSRACHDCFVWKTTLNERNVLGYPINIRFKPGQNLILKER